MELANTGDRALQSSKLINEGDSHSDFDKLGPGVLVEKPTLNDDHILPVVEQVVTPDDFPTEQETHSGGDHLKDLVVSVESTVGLEEERGVKIAEKIDLVSTAVKEEPKRNPLYVLVTLRPVDKNWVMGEDWVVDLHNLTTIADIRQYIETHRGISRHRIQLRLKGKVCPANREIWTLRRMGIYDGYTIQVEPTLSGAWLWNPKEYYVGKLLDDVCAIIEASHASGSAGRINLKDLSAKIKPPPCIKTSLRVFLRQYPERIYMHTDTTEGDIWVHVTKRPFQLPTFGNFSVEIGTISYYKPKKFDWAANKDIDDMYKIETLPEEEEEVLVEDGGQGASETAVDQSRKDHLAEEQRAREVAMGNEDAAEEDDKGSGEDELVDDLILESAAVTAS